MARPYKYKSGRSVEQDRPATNGNLLAELRRMCTCPGCKARRRAVVEKAIRNRATTAA